MKIQICAVGRMKAGPEKELAERYLDRFVKVGPQLGFDLSPVVELPESRAASAAERQVDECARLRAAFPLNTSILLLDERGKNLSSDQFAKHMAKLRDGGAKWLSIVIGGPDGHDASLRNSADLVLSFGSLTWPHQLARIMLAEQLYRGATILSGHPYHRT